MKAARDPIYWFENWCYTQDVHQDKMAKCRFPRFRHAKHLYHYIELLMTEKRILVPKSRQLMWSWTTSCFFLWATQFFQNQMNFFISQKQRKANSLIGRAKMVYMFQPCPPEVLGNIHTTVFTSGRRIGTSSTLPFYPPLDETGGTLAGAHVMSKIEAFSEDADDIRMDTASRVFFDEMAFMKDAEAAMAAIEPTLGVDGQLVGVSTPRGENQFYRLVYDLAEDEVV